MTVLYGLGLLLGLLILAAIGLSSLGQRRWTSSTHALMDRVEAGRTAPRLGHAAPMEHYDARELDGLPAPVQRYFRAVLTEGQPLVMAVTVEMAGRFNLSGTGELWRPFTSRQRVISRRPGFLWDARISIVPGLDVRVVDSYVAGRGLLRAAVQGLFTVADIQGEGEIARGEFMRWFAEVPWYPTALLPSQGVQWEAVDAHAARATVVDGPLSLSLLFRFNDDGLIGSLRAESRGSMVNGKMVMAPWEGTWSNYQTRGGMRLPFTGEVAWMRLEGRRSYFVGTVTTLEIEFAP